MAKSTSKTSRDAGNASRNTGQTTRKRKWFARRQVYLRTGQDSQYVELSPLLQIGVATAFGVFALWLAGASYGAVKAFTDDNDQTALLDRLNNAEQALSLAERDRDAALEDAARLPDLESELARIKAVADNTDAGDSEEVLEVRAELDQTKEQLGELQARLSESKADQAALQARYEAEASATTDANEKTAEEAASLHAQLEDAFGEIETLKQERSEAETKLAALTEESGAKDEATERNTALLKAATAEIERLQKTIADGEKESRASTESYQATITRLEDEREAVIASRKALETTVAALENELDEVRSAASISEEPTTNAPPTVTLSTGADAVAGLRAELQAQSIDAGLKEADLLATIEDLRARLNAEDDASLDAVAEAEAAGDDIEALRKRALLAEQEIERLLLAGLKANTSSEGVNSQSTGQGDAANGGSNEVERLRAELLNARADIIKLEADVKAGKLRLTEQAENGVGPASQSDNSTKLEQQLASSRSRVQQLNKALADAKLREVAIDLALINVVPTPSPPAPR